MRKGSGGKVRNWTTVQAIGVALVVGTAFFGLGRLGAADGDQQRFSSIPATLAVNAKVRPWANPGDGMLKALVALGPRYGFTVSPDPPTPQEPEWAVLLQCRDDVVALVHSAGKGQVIMGTLLIYGFKDRHDYALFEDEFVRLFERYGEIGEVKNGEILSDEELALRAKHFGASFASRCSPPAVDPLKAGAR
jgi:hypothetical protein